MGRGKTDEMEKEAASSDGSKKKETKSESKPTYKASDYFSGKGFDESTKKALKEAGAD